MVGTADAPQPKSVQDVRSLLYRKLRVTLVSGRVLEGDLSCLDKQGNLILSNTFEQVAGGPGVRNEERHMGLVLVPVQQRGKVELQASLDEGIAMMTLVGGYAKKPQ